MGRRAILFVVFLTFGASACSSDAGVVLDAGQDGAAMDAGSDGGPDSAVGMDGASMDGPDGAGTDAGADGPDAGVCASTYTDISAGQGNLSGTGPRVLIDTVNAKVLVVTQNGANSDRPALFRCNLDGTSCAYIDISAGEGVGSGQYPSAAIDSVNKKLLVATTYFGTVPVIQNRPGLFRCNLDGTGCTFTDISAGQGGGSGFYPSAAIDTTNAKLLVVTGNAANGNRPGLFRCNLDGTSCTHTDISAGQGLNSGLAPTAMIDSVNGKLLVVARNDANDGKPSLYRCNLDGTACTHTDISAGRGMNCAWGPRAVLDTANSKVLAVSEDDTNGQRPSLFRCNLDGTSCTWTDISAGQGKDTGYVAFPAIDAVNGKLLVVTDNAANSEKPSLFRCNLDGTSCTHTDISSGQGKDSGMRPWAAIDTTNGKLLVTTQNGLIPAKPALFHVCLQ